MTKAASALILFDLVSTITDAGPRYAQAYARMAEQYGLGSPDLDAIMQDLGNKNLKEIISSHSPTLPVDKMQSFMNDCNNACDTLLYDINWIERLFPQVRETLADLKAHGHKIGLFTGTREDAMQSQLRYHNILQYFDADLLRGKDNERDAHLSTQALKLAQMKSLIAAHQGRGPVIAVGDSISDYQAARECGIVFIGFAESWQKSTDMKDAGIIATFSDYRDLPDIIQSIVMNYAPANSLRHGFKPAA